MPLDSVNVNGIQRPQAVWVLIAVDSHCLLDQNIIREKDTDPGICTFQQALLEIQYLLVFWSGLTLSASKASSILGLVTKSQ